MKNKKILILALALSVIGFSAHAKKDRKTASGDAPAEVQGLDQLSSIDCGGTEPFWNLTLKKTGDLKYEALMSEPGAKYKPIKVNAGQIQGRTISHSMFFLEKKGGAWAIIHTPDTHCSDGMSDFEYQYEIYYSNDGGSPKSGCCQKIAGIGNG